MTLKNAQWVKVIPAFLSYWIFYVLSYFLQQIIWKKTCMSTSGSRRGHPHPPNLWICMAKTLIFSIIFFARSARDYFLGRNIIEILPNTLENDFYFNLQHFQWFLIIFLLFCNNLNYNTSKWYTINILASVEIITCFLMCCFKTIKVYMCFVIFC